MRPLPMLLALVPLAILLAAADGKRRTASTPTPMGVAAEVSTCAGCETWPPVEAAETGGQVLIGWRLLHDDNNLVLDFFGPGGRSGSLTSLSGSGFINFAGAVADPGGWVIAWEDQRVQRFLLARARAGQLTPADAVALNDDRPPAVIDGTPSVHGRDGRLLLLWSREQTENGPSDVLARRFDYDGNALGDTVDVGDSFGRTSAAACLRADGSAWVAWRQRSQRRHSSKVSLETVTGWQCGSADLVPS